MDEQATVQRTVAVDEASVRRGVRVVHGVLIVAGGAVTVPRGRLEEEKVAVAELRVVRARALPRQRVDPAPFRRVRVGIVVPVPQVTGLVNQLHEQRIGRPEKLYVCVCVCVCVCVRWMDGARDKRSNPPADQPTTKTYGPQS